MAYEQMHPIVNLKLAIPTTQHRFFVYSCLKLSLRARRGYFKQLQKDEKNVLHFGLQFFWPSLVDVEYFFKQIDLARVDPGWPLRDIWP